LQQAPVSPLTQQVLLFLVQDVICCGVVCSAVKLIVQLLLVIYAVFQGRPSCTILIF
jgi:hypothetical protein